MRDYKNKESSSNNRIKKNRAEMENEIRASLIFSSPKIKSLQNSPNLDQDCMRRKYS